MTVASGKTAPAGKSTTTWSEQPLLRLRQLVVGFLQGLFAQADTGFFRWSPDETSEIYITDESPLDLRIVGQRPAITVLRADINWGQTSIDERRDYNMQTEERLHTDLLSGTMVMNCCSRTPLEAEYIAWIASKHSWILRRLMIKGTPMHEIGRRQTIGALTPAGALVQGDSATSWINCPVYLPYHMQYNEKITPQDLQQLNRIRVFLEARLGVQLGPTEVRGQARAGGHAELPNVNIRPPTYRGRPIRQVGVEQRFSVKESSDGE
jgi:hypothetical protein